MKIDLHIHTNGTAKRTISNDDLIKKLSDEDVRLASITNHNVFDIEQYKYLSQNDKGVSFIPGIELNVEYQGEVKHIILYSISPEFLQTFNMPINSSLPFESFLEKVSNAKENTHISPHFLKDADKSFRSVNEIQQAFAFLIGNKRIKIMLEMPNKSKTIDLLSETRNLFHTAAFSDLQDWNLYDVDALTLPEVSKKIKNLDEYIHYIVDEKDSIFNTHFPEEKTYSYIDKFSKESKTTELAIGLNIVFGEKGSGKSNFLESFHESNDEFTFLTISNSNGINNMENLYDFFKDFILEKEESGKVETVIEKLNEIVPIPQIPKAKDFVPQNFIIESETYNKGTSVKIMRSEMELIKNVPDDISTVIQDYFNMLDSIEIKLLEISKVISSNAYSGSITKNDVDLIRKKNGEDMKGASLFNPFSFRNKLEKEIEATHKIISKPKIGFSKWINDMEKFTSEWFETLKKMKTIYSSIEENLQDNLFKSNVLGEKYELNLKLDVRSNGDKTKNDLKGIKQPELFEGVPKKDFSKTRFNFKDYWNGKVGYKEFSFKDAYNVWILSKAFETEFYLPSTGQLDMLKLDAHLQRNENLVIDEFCNTLDNKYVFEKLIKSVNNYDGIIVASTHNPIIAVIARVSKYIYTERLSDKCKLFYSQNTIFGDMVSLEGEARNTKEKLLDVIEGTKDAFDIRGGKYGFK